MGINYRRIAFLSLIAITMFVIANHAFALGVQTGPGLPGEAALDSFRRFILGPVAFTIVICAIFGLGWILVRQGGGDSSDGMAKAVWVLVGVGIILGATQLVSLFFPGATIPAELVSALAEAM